MKGEYISIDTAKKIAELKKEKERLNNIIDNAIKYVEKMSYQDIVDNPKKDLIKILKKEK